jgi:branched-chain amino acid transport system ATP-binding protein
LSTLLELGSISRHFGGYQALRDVSFVVTEADIHALIGPNGAGKTTLFNIISGTLRPSSGKLQFLGQDYVSRRPHAILDMGIARNFQQVRLFPGLSVVENVMVGCHARMPDHTWRDLLSFQLFSSAAERQARETAHDMLRFVGLEGHGDGRPGELTLVDQRRLEIARALASRPRLLLLDEPAAGMNPTEVAQISQLIRRIKGSGITVLLVEHHMRLVMDIASRITVLSAGSVLAEGTPDEIQRNADVISAYLGTDHDPAVGSLA